MTQRPETRGGRKKCIIVLVDFISEWSLLLVVELLAGGAVVRGGVLEELVEEGHLAAGPPVARVVAPHWKSKNVL